MMFNVIKKEIMKKLSIFFLLFMTIVATSCYDDKSSTDFEVVKPIVIDFGDASTSVNVFQFDTLKISAPCRRCVSRHDRAVLPEMCHGQGAEDFLCVLLSGHDGEFLLSGGIFALYLLHEFPIYYTDSSHRSVVFRDGSAKAAPKKNYGGWGAGCGNAGALRLLCPLFFHAVYMGLPAE